MASACLVVLCLPLPLVTILFLIDGGGGVINLMTLNRPNSELHTFVAGVALVFAWLRIFFVVPRFDESRLRMALSAMLIWPVCGLISQGVPVFRAPLCGWAEWSGRIAAVAMVGCIIELTIAMGTTGTRNRNNLTLS